MSLPKPYFETENGVLYHGDCLEILPHLDPVDLVLTDPPYGIDLEYDCYEDTVENWFKLMAFLIPLVKKISKMAIMPCCKFKNLKWIYDTFPPDWLICWYKGSVGHNSFIGFNDWEPHLVYGRVSTKIMTHDYFNTRPSLKKGTYGHPCPKPEDWAIWLIGKTTNVGMIVLDPFMGSGTTAIACEKLNRRWIGIEMSEKYCFEASKRIESKVDVLDKGFFTRDMKPKKKEGFFK
jgi:DNA modification methylase